MTIALGVTPAYVSGSTAGGTPRTTGIFTPQTSGSTFVIIGQSSGSLTWAPSDSQGNSYVPAGVLVVDSSDGISCQMWYCANAVGAANMTASVTPSASAFVGVNFIEITGAATSSVLDQYFSNGSIFSPYNSPVTITQASELILSFLLSGNTVTVTANAGFSVISGSAGTGSAVMSLVTSATGTYNPAATISPSGGRCNVMTASFATTPVVKGNPSQFFLGANLLPLAPLAWVIGRRNKLSGVRRSWRQDQKSRLFLPAYRRAA